MSTKTSWSGIALLVVGFGVVAPAQAMLITNGATTIFYDDFESPAPGGVWDNGALPGVWGNTSGALSATPGVTRGAEVAVPAAFQGVQKGEVSGSYQFDGYAEFGVQSGTVKATWMQYIQPGALAFDFIIALEGSGTGTIAALSNSGGANNTTILDITHGVSTPLNLVRGQWQKFEIEYTSQSSNVTVRVDDVAHTYAMTQPREGDPYLVYVRGGDAGTTYYIDAIPEPGSAALIAMAALGTLGRPGRRV